ncbi:outer membrane protein [Bartonella sp. B39]
MNKRLIITSIFTLFSSSIVQAADMVVPEEPVYVASVGIASPSFSWEGFYFGGQVGGFSSKTSAITPDVDIPLYPDEDSEKKEWVPVEKHYMPKPSGFIGGLYVGANFDLGNNFILGIDTDILLTNRKDTKTIVVDFDGGYDIGEDENERDGKKSNEKKLRFGVGKSDKFSRSVLRSKEEREENRLFFSHTLKQKWAGATRMRVGFSTGRVMPYISGGIAYGQLQDVMSISITGEDSFNETSDIKKTMIGYTLGGGIDFAMTDNIIVRAEYRYSDFGKKKFDDEIEIKYKTNDFRAGIAYKF